MSTYITRGQISRERYSARKRADVFVESRGD
jgi:hypothetical protein